MYITPEKELYTIIQLFYSGNYKEITDLDLDTEFDFSNILYDIEAQFYKIRANLILNNYDSASNLLSNLNKNLSDLSSIDNQTKDVLLNDIKILNYFIDFKKLNDVGKIDYDLLNSFDDKLPTLATLYKKIIINDVQIDVQNPDLDLESYLLLLFSSDSEISNSALIDLKNHYSDSLILDFAIAWLGLINPSSSNSDDTPVNTKNSYYFFEELTSSSNTDSIKNVINLLACHLKLGNIPEALDCLAKLNSMENSHITKQSWNHSLLINKIALTSINGDSVQYNSLIDEIKKKFPDSYYVKDLVEKEQLFDSIVSTYN